MLNRWTERDGLWAALDDLGVGSIAFSPLAQGLLTGRYLDGVPEGSRATQGKSLKEEHLAAGIVERLRGLNDLARERGQTLAQMALAWILREGRATSALIGASRPGQIEDCVGAVGSAAFSEEDLARIEELTMEGALLEART